MSLRNWAIRGLILAGVAAVAVLGWVAFVGEPGTRPCPGDRAPLRTVRGSQRPRRFGPHAALRRHRGLRYPANTPRDARQTLLHRCSRPSSTRTRSRSTAAGSSSRKSNSITRSSTWIATGRAVEHRASAHAPPADKPVPTW